MAPVHKQANLPDLQLHLIGILLHFELGLVLPLLALLEGLLGCFTGFPFCCSLLPLLQVIHLQPIYTRSRTSSLPSELYNAGLYNQMLDNHFLHLA